MVLLFTFVSEVVGVVCGYGPGVNVVVIGGPVTPPDMLVEPPNMFVC